MSTQDNTPVDVSDDLDTFSDTFFGQDEPQPDKEPASSEGEDESEDEVVDAQEDEDTHDGDDTTDTEADDESDEDEGEDEPDPEPKPKKNRFQERIDDLTGKQREAERRADELQRQLDEMERSKGKQDEAPAPKTDIVEPTADDKNEDGTDKYPLGEFDPQFIKDLTKHSILQEREAIKAEEQQKSQQAQDDAVRAELEKGWQAKIVTAEERYPDFREKGATLAPIFEGIDQSYSQYITATMMDMEYGADVLYHLANNPDEAKRILSSSPTKATIALGRLESKFADAAEEKQKARPKISNAPTPPARVNKGTSAAQVVPDDTDDLDAFAEKLFKPKRRS